MTALRTAAQQALEALTNCSSEYGHRCNRCDSEVDEGGKVAAALRAALARQDEPVQEPVATLIAQRDALLEALKEAATSLETVGRLAGKSDYLGDAGERIPTYMGRHDEVREYATSRAGVARAAIKAVEDTK